MRWRLVVYNGRRADIALHRLRLSPSKYHAGEYVGFYALNARPQLDRHIEACKAMGLHGLAKKVVDRKHKKPASPRPKPEPPQPTKQPSAKIIAIETAARARLNHDAEKRAVEFRSQKQKKAQREAQNRAERAVLRAKGEL
jgi:hypothetical protein